MSHRVFFLASLLVLTACPNGRFNPPETSQGGGHSQNESSENACFDNREAAPPVPPPAPTDSKPAPTVCKPSYISMEHLGLTQRTVKLPGLPAGSVAYNAGMANAHGQMIMAFRLDMPDGNSPVTAYIGIVPLNENFQPAGPFSLLDTTEEGDVRSTAEDPRLINYDDDVYLVYNTTHEPKPVRHMHIGRIESTRVNIESAPVCGESAPDRHELHYSLHDRKEMLFAPDKLGPRTMEKNWTPFVYQGDLHFIYDTNPPRVLRVEHQALLNSETQQLLAEEVSHSAAKVAWDWGHMRGGTQAVYDAELGRYISFFHSSGPADLRGTGRQRYYVMGLYTFMPEPPFDIDSMTPLSLVAPSFYRQVNPYQHIVFPQGMVLDGDQVHVSYGQDDASIRVLSVDRKALLNELRPVDLDH